MWSISIEIIIFVFTIVLAMTDSSAWPATFFYVTMLSVGILNSEYSPAVQFPNYHALTVCLFFFPQ